MRNDYEDNHRRWGEREFEEHKTPCNSGLSYSDMISQFSFLFLVATSHVVIERKVCLFYFSSLSLSLFLSVRHFSFFKSKIVFSLPLSLTFPSRSLIPFIAFLTQLHPRRRRRKNRREWSLISFSCLETRESRWWWGGWKQMKVLSPLPSQGEEDSSFLWLNPFRWFSSLLVYSQSIYTGSYREISQEKEGKGIGLASSSFDKVVCLRWDKLQLLSGVASKGWRKERERKQDATSNFEKRKRMQRFLLRSERDNVTTRRK